MPASPKDADPAHLPTEHAYAIFRNPDYRRFLIAGMIATIGRQILGVAVGWDLYERTGSPAALGFVGLAQVLPVILLAIPAGHAADRLDRKIQLIVAHLLFFTAASGLMLVSWLRGPVGLVYAFLVIHGTAQALNMPARWAILPQVVPREQISQAITWNTSTFQIAAVLGPALGGVVIALPGGASKSYLINAVCSLIVISLVIPMRLRPYARDFEPVSMESLLAGIKFVFSTELILATITLDLLAVLLGGATALLPIFAKDILAIGPRGLGWLRAAPAIGAFLTAIYLAHRPPLRRAGWALLWSVAGFGLATIIFGISRSPALSFLMLFLTGAFDNISVVVRHSLVQVLTPDSMRGRVSAVNAIFIGSSNELGELESGLTARLLGTVPAVVLGGVGSMLVVLGVGWGWPSIRRLRSVHEAARDMMT